jgi:hypothetical protein
VILQKIGKRINEFGFIMTEKIRSSSVVWRWDCELSGRGFDPSLPPVRNIFFLFSFSFSFLIDE